MGVNLEGADKDYIKGGTNVEADPMAHQFICEYGLNLKIVGMRPTMISQFFPEVSQEEAEEVEKDIIEIINNAKHTKLN